MSDPVALSYHLPMPKPLPDHIRARARLEVCRRAVDVSEARRLLEMLGLIRVTA